MTVYSPDLRQRIIDAHRDGEGSIRALADRFCVSPATVQSYLKRWRETGSAPPAEYRHGPEPTILDKHLGRVRRLVEENNDRTLEEYAAMYSKGYRSEEHTS